MLLHGIIWYCIVLLCTRFHCKVLNVISLYCMSLYCIWFHCIVLHVILLNCMILHSFIFYLISLHGIACHFIALYGIAWYCIVFGFFARYRTVMYRCYSAPANYRVVHLVIFDILRKSYLLSFFTRMDFWNWEMDVFAQSWECFWSVDWWNSAAPIVNSHLRAAAVPSKATQYTPCICVIFVLDVLLYFLLYLYHISIVSNNLSILIWCSCH